MRRYSITPHMTPARLRFLRELERLGVGEPYNRGTTRNHCLKLGWIEGAYEVDGRVITDGELRQVRPPGTDRWTGVRFAGVTLTDEGRAMLRSHGESTR